MRIVRISTEHEKDISSDIMSSYQHSQMLKNVKQWVQYVYQVNTTIHYQKTTNQTKSEMTISERIIQYFIVQMLHTTIHESKTLY